MYVKHNSSNTRAYNSWESMKRRCLDPKDKDYPNYGGRGITICDSWLDASNFIADMGQPPKGMTLNRIDNNGPYSPDNCRWSTQKEQCNNKRNNTLLTYNGKTQTLQQWADETGLRDVTIHGRLRRGWAVADALTKPPMKMKGREDRNCLHCNKVFNVRCSSKVKYCSRSCGSQSSGNLKALAARASLAAKARWNK